ncbi:inner membrane protein import complex subunit Tim54-domain-containing protein [Tuber borchii]|uniref:Mitochondrial import inner membrane translocase subunit TIM54 n=1 Tax=Tuber borchii TaxID=42251 RepID=A0A2T6ZXW7_TUBBO|nr:inner membrane protein import complex subunit Tim54-domain-containing protein [Tuber borchii]
METQPPPPPPAAPPPPPPRPQGNPAFRAMGLPNIRAKLPSRNWSIFISLSTAFAAAVYYDRRETKRVQKHWCSVVEHLAREPLSTLELPRKVTVYLSAPPGDTITPSIEYFREYVKPVFTAAALDFDVGLGGGMDPNAPPTPPPAPPQELKPPSTPTLDQALAEPPPESPDLEKKSQEEEIKKKKNTIPPPHILPHAYNTSPTPRVLPETFDPVGFIPHAHILGFLNTPIRLYRFLNHRKTADLAGREAAAIAFGIYSRPFNLAPEPGSTITTNEDVKRGLEADQEGGEINYACGREEEAEWPKRVWKEEGTRVGEITEEVAVDRRIGGRMRKFVLPEGLEVAVAAGKGEV